MGLNIHPVPRLERQEEIQDKTRDTKGPDYTQYPYLQHGHLHNQELVGRKYGDILDQLPLPNKTSKKKNRGREEEEEGDGRRGGQGVRDKRLRRGCHVHTWYISS